jgi:hypothetical protein
LLQALFAVAVVGVFRMSNVAPHVIGNAAPSAVIALERHFARIGKGLKDQPQQLKDQQQQPQQQPHQKRE